MAEGKRKPPAANRGPSKLSDDDIHILRPLSDTLSDFEVALLADAFRQASRDWWLKRAADWEMAKPRPGEWHGNRTAEELNAQWSHAHEVARACRAKAALITISEEFAELLRDVA